MTFYLLLFYRKISKNKTRDIIFTTLLYLIIIFVFVVIGSFVYYAFIDNFIINKSFSLKHFEYVLSNDIGKYILNSLLIAVSVAVIGTFITYFTAYATARIKGKIAKLIHILTISSLAIPGIVLGLSYTIGFKDTFIYNTFIIMIIVNIIHFMASPYLMAYNALLKITSDLKYNPENLILSNENYNTLLNNIIISLSPNEKEIFNLIKENYSYNDISKILNLNIKQVYNSVYRIKDKVKTIIEN